MSDLTLIAEDIINTMQAVDEAYSAKQKLCEKPDLMAFDAFRIKMIELQDRLSKLKLALNNEAAFAMDELVDALSSIHCGHLAKYRRTPRMNR